MDIFLYLKIGSFIQKVPLMKIVATDLDGTILPAGGKVSRQDLETLKMLGNRGVVRVIATGRSFYAILQHIPRTFPIDYLIFSTGVGLMNWRTGEIIISTHIKSNRVKFLVEHMLRHNVDFMLHSPAPDTHKFYYSGTDAPIIDYSERQKHYSDFCHPLKKGYYPDSSQALAFIPNDDNLYQQVTLGLEDYKVIRTTSPINEENIWIEVFEKNVSKGHTLEMLAGMLNVSKRDVMAIGNDFNDIDMLDFTANSFVVENAPEVLKEKYRVVANAANSGFTQAVKLFLSDARK